MLAFRRGIGRDPKHHGHHNAGDLRPVRRTSIRVLAPLVASAAVFLLTPAIASADTADTGAAAGQTSATGTVEIASISTGIGPSLFGLDLAALLWVLVAVLAVAAGLIGGSRSVAGAPAGGGLAQLGGSRSAAGVPAGGGLAQNAAAQPSVVAPVAGQPSFGTRQATGTINDPNGA